MGLRTTRTSIGSANASADEMAPALTEPISQPPKITLSTAATATSAAAAADAAASSPRPEILTSNNLCESTDYLYLGAAETKQTKNIDFCSSVIATIAEYDATAAAVAAAAAADKSLSNDPTTSITTTEPLAATILHMDTQNEHRNDDIEFISKHQNLIDDPLSTLDVFDVQQQINQPPVQLVTLDNDHINSQHIQQQQHLQQQHQSLDDITATSVSSVAMGLQKDYLKDSAEVDQMLGELTSNNDILMQVFKSFESVPAGDNLCELAGGLALFNDVDVMNIGLDYVTTGPTCKDTETEDIRNEIEKRQVQMERKCDFLIRRLRKLQARYMGQHINEEINSLFEYTQQLVKHKDRGIKSITTMTPLTCDKQKQLPFAAAAACSMKNLIKRIDQSAVQHQTSMHKNRVGRPSKQQLELTAAAAATVALAQSTPAGAAAVSTPSSSSFSSSTTTIGKNIEQQQLLLQQQQQQQQFCVVPPFDSSIKNELQSMSGSLAFGLKHVCHDIDSDATLSSSGGESADETIDYKRENEHQVSITKRALWRYARDRAAIASRYSWLLSQISDLEYRIRQHSELHQQIKKYKGPIQFEGGSTVVAAPMHSSLPVNGYRGGAGAGVGVGGLLPLGTNTKPCDINDVVSPNGAFDASSLSASASAMSAMADEAIAADSSTLGSCRTRAFQKSNFKKRKLTQIINLHTVSKKAAKPSTIKCGCQWPLQPCGLCTGRTDPTAPRELPDTMSYGERVSLLDAGFHSVLSLREDIPQSIHFECTMRRPEWQTKASRSSAKAILKGAIALQKQIERENSGSMGGGGVKHHQAAGHNQTHNIIVPKKYQRKLGRFVANNKLRKNGKKSKIGRLNATHPINNKHRKKSHHSIASDMEFGVDGDMANGSLPRSKTSSPTSFCISKHENRKNKNYDIDNIVIPYSVAALTKIEVLKCKEIPTPKWRLLDDDANGKCIECSMKMNDANENITELENNSKNTLDVNKLKKIIKIEKETSVIKNDKTIAIDGGKCLCAQKPTTMSESTKMVNGPKVNETTDPKVIKIRSIENNIMETNDVHNKSKDDSILIKVEIQNKIQNETQVNNIKRTNNKNPANTENDDVNDVDESIDVMNLDENVINIRKEPMEKGWKKNEDKDLRNNEIVAVKKELATGLTSPNSSQIIKVSKLKSSPKDLITTTKDMLKNSLIMDSNDVVPKVGSKQKPNPFVRIKRLETVASEDTSYEAYVARHERALAEERKKFATYLKFPWSTRSRANRRIDSKAESSGTNTPDRASPAPKTPNVGAAAGNDNEMIPSPAEPSTPQPPSEHDSGKLDPPLLSIVHSTIPLAVNTLGPSNGNIIPLSSQKAERRRTISTKRMDSRDETARYHHLADKDIGQPFDNLEFPLPNDIFESMINIKQSNVNNMFDVASTNYNKAHIKTTTTATPSSLLTTGTGGSATTTTTTTAIATTTQLLPPNNRLSTATTATPTTASMMTTTNSFQSPSELSMYFDSTGYSRIIADSDEETESVDSEEQYDEDPNDPEWCEPPSRT